MDSFYIELGIRLRAERLRKHHSLQYVAERIGVTGKTVLNYESGTSKIDFPTIKRICSTLGIDAKKLILESIDASIDNPQLELNRIKSQ